MYLSDVTLMDGLPFVGHAIFLFEADGVWWRTEFSGRNKKDATIKLRSIGTTFDLIGYLLNVKANGFYLKGDFSACYNVAEKYQNTNYGGYNLITNNCLHYVREVMLAGEYRNSWIKMQVSLSNQIIPQLFYLQLLTGFPSNALPLSPKVHRFERSHI